MTPGTTCFHPPKLQQQSQQQFHLSGCASSKRWPMVFKAQLGNSQKGPSWDSQAQCLTGSTLKAVGKIVQARTIFFFCKIEKKIVIPRKRMFNQPHLRTCICGCAHWYTWKLASKPTGRGIIKKGTVILHPSNYGDISLQLVIYSEGAKHWKQNMGCNRAQNDEQESSGTRTWWWFEAGF